MSIKSESDNAQQAFLQMLEQLFANSPCRDKWDFADRNSARGHIHEMIADLYGELINAEEDALRNKDYDYFQELKDDEKRENKYA